MRDVLSLDKSKKKKKKRKKKSLIKWNIDVPQMLKKTNSPRRRTHEGVVGVAASTSTDQHHRAFWKLLTDCSQPQPRRRAQPPFTNKTVPSAPADPNSYSHTCWQRCYHLKITVFFLLFTAFLKKQKNKQAPQAYAVSPFRPPRCICTYRRQREIEVDVVLIRKRPASWLICTDCPHIGCCYYCCCCTGRSKKKKKRQAGRHRATAQRHRWKAQSFTLWSSFSVEP